MSCSGNNPKPTPTRIISTAWGADVPASWGRIDGPLECVAIGAGSQARGLIIENDAGRAVVTSSRPWVGRTGGPTTLYPLDSSGFSVWSTLDNYRLEIDTYLDAPTITPAGDRDIDRASETTTLPALALNLELFRVWVSGRSSANVRVATAAGDLTYSVQGYTFSDGSTYATEVGSGVLAPGGVAVVDVEASLYDQLRVFGSSFAGTVATVIGSSNG